VASSGVVGLAGLVAVLATLRDHPRHGTGRTVTGATAAVTVLLALLRFVAAMLFLFVVLATHTVILLRMQRLAAGNRSFDSGGRGNRRQPTIRFVGSF